MPWRAGGLVCVLSLTLRAYSAVFIVVENLPYHHFVVAAHRL